MSVAHFDAIASVYDESLPAHVVGHYLRKRTAYVLRHCPTGAGLDVGCGTGSLAQRLAEAGYQMTGVDPSRGMLEILRRQAPSVRAVQASGGALPFPDNRFELVITVATLHHIADRAQVRATLEEMVRVLKPGGRLVVWDHNSRNPRWRSLMARVPQDTGEERLIGEQEIVTGLRSAGATAVSCVQLGFVPDFVPPALLKAASVAERLAERTPMVRRYGAHNVVLASKPPQ